MVINFYGVKSGTNIFGSKWVLVKKAYCLLTSVQVGNNEISKDLHFQKI